MKVRLLALCLVLITASCSVGGSKAVSTGTPLVKETPAGSPLSQETPTGIGSLTGLAGSPPAQAVSTATASLPAAGTTLSFPIRAAFFYPWFPEAWRQEGLMPFTQYHPHLGNYNQDDPSVIRQQIAAMMYGKIQAGIASWWGQGSPTDQRVASLLKEADAVGFHWMLYVESEGIGNPSPDAIRSDLVYIRDHYANDPAYVKVEGRFVVFVYADPNDGCNMPDRWLQANQGIGAYLVLKIFPGYRKCQSQPDGWHQYAPSSPENQAGPYSYSISPGFWRAGATQPRLARDLQRWATNIQAMIASHAKFQLITTFNEWGEGTAVESAKEWSSPSGYGSFLDLLHNDGKIPDS